MTTMPDGGVLALDLSATVIGWACAPLTWKQPEFGYWTLPKIGGVGARYAAFVDKVNDTMDAWNPAHVVIENPLPPNVPNTNVDTMMQIYAIVGFVHEACFRHSVPFHGCHVDTIRTNVMGRCRWVKGETKSAVVQFCRQELKLDVTDHNAADAIICWHDYRQKILGIPSAKQPLFRWDLAD